MGLYTSYRSHPHTPLALHSPQPVNYHSILLLVSYFVVANMSPLRRRDPQIDPKVLALVMAQSQKNGYLVSESYAIKMLQKNEYKLVPAIKNIKIDIDARESSFSTIPQVRVLEVD